MSTAALGLCLVLAAFPGACGQDAADEIQLHIVAGGGDRTRAALELALEMLDPGERVSFVTGTGRRLLDDRTVTRSDLGGKSSRLARGALQALASLEEPDVVAGLREVAPSLAPGDRVAVVTAEPEPTRLAAQLGAALLGGRGANLQVMWPGGADALLVETPALSGGGVHELDEQPTPQAIARLLGDRFYRGGAGEFLLPGGSGDLLAFVPPGTTPELLLGGEPVPRPGLVAHELESWRALRWPEPSPGTYELAGVSSGQSAVVVARLPWTARVRLSAPGTIDIVVRSRDPLITPFAPELRVVATLRHQDGRLDMLPAVPVGDAEDGTASTRWRAQLVPDACGQVIVDLELLSGELGATGWRLREVLCVCGNAGDAASPLTADSLTPGASTRQGEPGDPGQAPPSLRVEPARLDLGALEQGAVSLEGRLGLSRSDEANVLLESLEASLRDGGGRRIEVECIPSMHLPADLGSGRVEVGVSVRVLDRDVVGRLTGRLAISVGGVAPVSIPIEVEVIPVLLRFDPPRVEMSIPLDALPATRPFESTLIVSAGTSRTLRLRGGSAAGDDVEIVLAGSSATTSRQAPGTVAGQIRAGGSLRPGRYRAVVTALGPDALAAELEIELEVLPALVSLASEELRLAPVGPGGDVLVGSTMLAGAPDGDVEVATSLQRGPQGARARGTCSAGRVTVVVAVPDDEVGEPIEGVARVVVAMPSGTPRRFELRFLAPGERRW